MAALDFPASPSINDSYVGPNGRRWTWNGAKWVLAFGSIDLGATGPTGPTGPTGATGANSTVTGPTGPTGATGAGYVNLPISGLEKTTTYSLGTGDIGKYIQVGTGGSITIPNSTFAQGDIVTILNNTSSTVTITCNTTTAYIASLTTNKGGGGTVTLATRGMASVLFTAATVCYISGNIY